MCRYIFGKKFMKVMDGPLKGYQWTTGSSYEYILGNYEDPDVIKAFSCWLKPASIFYDLGGNIGFYALLANRYIITGRIYSFEPMPANRQLFEQHLLYNQKRMGNIAISLLPFALSDREKELEFSDNPDQLDGNTYIRSSPNFKAVKHTITVKCFSIDELVQQGYEPPDIIKIDVEGAEYDVLLGAVGTLKKYRPRILLATHDCHLPGVRDSCLSFLKGIGYAVDATGKHNKQFAGLDDYIAVYAGEH